MRKNTHKSILGDVGEELARQMRKQAKKNTAKMRASLRLPLPLPARKLMQGTEYNPKSQSPKRTQPEIYSQGYHVVSDLSRQIRKSLPRSCVQTLYQLVFAEAVSYTRTIKKKEERARNDKKKHIPYFIYDWNKSSMSRIRNSIV